MTFLSPMPPSSFASYREASVTGYADDNIASGRWPESGALDRACAEFDRNLPLGVATPDNFIFEINDEESDAVVGVIWFAVVERSGVKSAHIFDIEIKPQYRRRGHARAAFRAIEEEVKALGLSAIGLHVFWHNAHARNLYASLGYAETGVQSSRSAVRYEPGCHGEQ
ncbi:MAG: GNAT family N-acetyltransferase [Verrucomicrobiales bacterium]